MKAGWTPTRIALAAGLFLILGLYVLYPQSLVMGQSLQPQEPEGGLFSNFGFIFSDSYYLTGILNSVWISLVSVLLAALIGLPAALLVDRFRFPGRSLILAGSILPLALPPLVGVVAIYNLIDITGFMPQMLARMTGASPHYFDLTGIPGILLVHAYSFSVYFFALTRAGLAHLDPTLEFAAGSLGASLPARIRRVILPALTPYLIAAALLTFMTSMSSYSAPAIIGNQTRYMTVALGGNGGDFSHRGAALAVILSFCNIGFLLILQLGFGGAWRALGGGSKGLTAPPLRHRFPSVRTEMAFGLMALTFFVLMAAPFAAIALNAFADHPAWNASSQILPPDYSADSLYWLFGSPDSLRVIGVSVFATVVAVVGNLVVAVVAAWLQVRGSRGLRFCVDFLCMLPIALPGTVIAYNLLAAFNQGSILTLGQSLTGTVTILMLAYFIRQIPLAVRPVVAAMARVDPVYERAAQSLGATPGTIFRRVILPQLWPGVAAAGLLCTVAGLGEYVASALLAGGSNTPISIAIETAKRSSESRGHANVLALALVVLTAGVMVGYVLLTRRGVRR